MSERVNCRFVNYAEAIPKLQEELRGLDAQINELMLSLTLDSTVSYSITQEALVQKQRIALIKYRDIVAERLRDFVQTKMNMECTVYKAHIKDLLVREERRAHADFLGA